MRGWGSGTGPPPHTLPCSGSLPLCLGLLSVSSAAAYSVATTTIATTRDTAQHPLLPPPPGYVVGAASQPEECRLCGHTTYNKPSIKLTASQCMPTPRKSALLSDKHTTNYSTPNVPCCTARSQECIGLQNPCNRISIMQ